MIPDYLDGPSVITKVLIGGKPLESRKGTGIDFPLELSERMQPC